jgi:Zn-finger nucleic acid-binding protein
MNCPRCVDVELLEKDRDGITVDGCPRCRGIWLDRGELERLIVSVAKHHDDDDDHRDRDRDRERDHPRTGDRHLDLAVDPGRDRDRHREHDRHDDYDRYSGSRRRKPRTWLEGLKDMFD